MCVLVALVVLAVCGVPLCGAAARVEEEEGYGLRLSRRVNAHGDEYMGLASTADGGKLIVGTEKGEVLVWGVAERRFVQRLKQGSPVHAVVMLPDGRHVLAAGGPHDGAAQRGVLRRWDLQTGSYEEWAGAERGSVMLLSYEGATGLVVALVGAEEIIVWNAETGKKVASWDLGRAVTGVAVVGRTVYVSAADAPQEQSVAKEGEGDEEGGEDEEEVEPNSIIALDTAGPDAPARVLLAKQKGRLWGTLTPSPGGRLIAARFYDEATSSSLVALLEASTGKELGTFEGAAGVWAAQDVLLISGEDGQPTQRVRVVPEGTAVAEEIAKGATWHGTGDPAGLSGQVVSKDGAKVWASYEQGAALVEWNLGRKEADVLTQTNGFPYALDALEEEGRPGLLITGGDDSYVRVWNLSDLSLRREFKVPFGVPQGVALLAGGARAVYSYGSGKGATGIRLADLRTGEEHTLLEVAEPSVRVYAAAGGFVYRRNDVIALASTQDGSTLREFSIGEPFANYAVSRNGRWLAAGGESGALNLFEVSTGRRVLSKTAQIDDISRIAVTGDGRYVYTTEWEAHLRRWDTRADTSDDIGEYRGQSSFLRLSKDERRVVVGGNHRDVGVYDAASGSTLAYFRVTASDFYVTNGWLSGDRLIFTTDSGVMFDGLLFKEDMRD
ncbi:MAG: WD40 repeat domain-containing protein [Pyrinomonadaceae bacterium]